MLDSALQSEVISHQNLDNVVRRNFDGVDGSAGLNQRCGVFHQKVFQQQAVTWAREDDNAAGGKVWTPYDEDVSARLEAAYIHGETRVEIDDERYVDLAAMRQCRHDNPRRRRKIQRTEAASGPPQGVQCASPLDLIRASLEESGVAARYLLVISQTDIASSLGLLRSKAGMMGAESSGCEVIFGSSFPGDAEYQHLCRNINRVKICMEMGKTVVLLNLRSVMESLYELLNQYFVEYGTGEHRKRYVEIGLGDQRMKCSVHADFRLVIIAGEEEVLHTFPIPLLNRLEKHVLSTAGVLEAEDNADANAAVTAVRHWACAFVSSQENEAQGLREAFVGYSDDLIPAIVFRLVQGDDSTASVRGDTPLSREQLIELTKDKLLQLATPDAVLRVAYSAIVQQEEEIKERYFRQQPHSRLRDYVKNIQAAMSTITTHEQSPVPSLADVEAEVLCDSFASDEVSALRLGDFDSEREFEAKVRDFHTHTTLRLLIVQCRARHLDLLTNAKYIVQSYEKGQVLGKHVLFLVHLPQKACTCAPPCRCNGHKYAVAVDGWEPLHMDCILPPSDRNPLDASYLAMTPMRLSAIISGEASVGDSSMGEVEDLQNFFEPEPEPVEMEPEPEPELGDRPAGPRVNIRTLLKDTVQAALSLVRNPNASTGALTALIKFMLKRLVPSSDGDGEEELASKRLCQRLLQRALIDMMSKKEELMESGGEQWVKVRAKDIGFVQKSGSFRGALYTHLQQNITSVFRAVLTALSTNDNLSLLVRHWDQPARRERWLALAESEMFSVQGEVVLNPDPTMEYVVAYKWKQGTEPAQSSFSWIIYSAIESIRGKMEQLAGTKTPLQCLREELRQHSHLWLTDDEESLRCYTTDFVRQNYSVGSTQLADLFQFLIFEVAKLSRQSPPPQAASLIDMFASDAPLPAAEAAAGVIDIPAVHCAAWTLDTRLEQLALMLSPATPLGKNADTFEMLHAVLVSVADGITMPSIDMTVLRFVLESLELRQEHAGDASKAWFNGWDALRAPVESWLSICGQSVAAAPELQAELHSLELRYARLRAVHLFMRVTGAHQYAHQLYARFHSEEINPYEPDTLKMLKRFLDHCIRDSETARFPGGMECAICLSMVRKGIALPCRNVFCGECIVTTYPRNAQTLIHDKFQCPTCLEDVENYIVDLDGDREVVNAAARVCALRDKATQFFLEYVAEFLGEGFPSPIVDALWPIITGTDLAFNDQEAELELQSSPALCAFLLRVLLTLDESAIGETCVQLLLERLDAHQLQQPGPRDIGLLTLVTEALEDVFSQRMAKHTHGSPEHVHQLNELVDVAEELIDWDGLSTESKWLQAIAALRIALKDIAEELYHQASGTAPTPTLAPIIQRVHTILEGCNRSDRGPFMHLLKCILQAQWGGIGAMLQVADNARRAPRMPFAAMIAGVVVKDPELPPDVFVTQLAAGTGKEPYANVLALCRDALDPIKVEELKGWVAQNQQPLPMALLSLAVCRVAHEQHSLGDAGLATTRALGEVVGEAMPVIADSLNNRVGRDGGKMRFSTDQAVADRQLMLLCLHCAATTSTGNALSAPLARMATHSIADSYLPTMREDVKDAVVGVVGDGGERGQFCTCPNGHPYFIGNCGVAMQVSKCPECGAVIGATADRSHQTRGDQGVLDLNADSTPKGYALTDDIIASPVPERALTLSGVAMARVILVLSMLSAVTVGPMPAREQASTNLRHGAMAAPGVGGMETWLTQQLQLTLDALAKVLSKNVDDTILVVHIALNHMMQQEMPAGQMWATKPDRMAWEQSFEALVAPFVADLDATLQAAATQIEAAAEADEGASRRLMHELQETATAASVRQPLQIGDTTLQPQHTPELWRYRTKVSVAHFQQRLAAASAEVAVDCVAVDECTKRIVALAAMRYLPDILHLQRALVERLERRISHQDAAKVTLQAKLDELWSGAADSHERVELDRCVQSFLAAWRILKQPVGDQPAINQGADRVLRLDAEMSTHDLTETSMLHFFIPATSDLGQKTVPGQIGVAMVNCLLNHHNELVRKLAPEGEEPSTISVRSVREEHLITFDEEALLPILFANVDRQVFDLGYGRGHRVEYEFVSVEAAIRHRFIAGKPRIEVRQGTEITTRLKFRNDVHAGHITAGLKEAVPQADLKPNMVQNILSELAGSVDKTAATLRALETAIGFLHNSRGDGDRLKDMLLQTYLADVLMMDDDLSILIGKVAAKTVELRHILSLMQALDQQVAEEEAQMGRDTFSSQPKEYKADLSPERAMEMRAGLRGQNCHKLAPLLRTFILENLTANMLETYQPGYLLVDDEAGVLELLDELEEFWLVLGPLKVTCGEVVSFWKLVVEGCGGAKADAGGGGGAASPGMAGTMAFRAGQNAGP